MADLLRITTPINPRTHVLPSSALMNNSAVFDLVDLTKVLKPNDRSEEFRQTDNSFAGNSTSLLDVQLKISKDASFGANLLKGIIDGEFLAKFSSSLPANVINEFNEFAKNIFISGDRLGADLATQEKSATAFSGEFFDTLRELLSQNNSPEFKNALGTLLKNTFSLMSQNEVLSSLSEGLNFLSEVLTPSKNISEQLASLAKQFAAADAAGNFSALRDSALKLLQITSESLLATDQTNDLISLIKYNLSRFNDNPNNLKASFQSVLSFVSDENLKASLADSLEKLIQGGNFPQAVKDALLSENDEFYQLDKLAYKLADDMRTFSNGLSENVLKNVLSATESELSRALSANGGDITIAQGSELIKNLLSNIAPEGAKAQIAQLMQSFQQTGDLNTLINRLSHILNSLDGDNIKSLMAKAMNPILTSLSKSSEIVYLPPSSMEQVADFLLKALGNENIRYLGIVDPNVVVQNMLTSPGVFTPLLHFVLPVEEDDLRSYGDLWIEDESDSSEDGERATHLFLSFEIERMGIFELEIFAKSNDLDISLFCPPDFAKPLSSLKSTIPQIASRAGYNVTAAKIAPLTKVRNLTDVFTSVAERRVGLNVKV